MSFGMYQASIPGFIKTLNNLTAILDKAERYAADRKIAPEVLLTWRIAPDMFPLMRQIQLTSDFAKSAPAQGGAQISRRREDLRRAEGAHRQDAEIRRRLYPEGPRWLRNRDVTFTLGGQNVHFKGEAYLVHFVLPNFYFHAATAYDIIRSFGVEIGKRDFLGM